MLDRLLHRATGVAIADPSYRLRIHQSISDKWRKALNAHVYCRRRDPEDLPIYWKRLHQDRPPDRNPLYC